MAVPEWMKFAFADNSKSGKREVANLLLLMWAVVYFKLFLFSDKETMETHKGLFADLTPWMLGFVAAAYGLDYVMKNRVGGGPPASSAGKPAPGKTLPAD